MGFDTNHSIYYIALYAILYQYNRVCFDNIQHSFIFTALRHCRMMKLCLIYKKYNLQDSCEMRKAGSYFRNQPRAYRIVIETSGFFFVHKIFYWIVLVLNEIYSEPYASFLNFSWAGCLILTTYNGWGNENYATLRV